METQMTQTSPNVKDKTETQAIAQRLYRAMPGAKMPSNVDGYAMWGDIDATPEWEFCETIAAELAWIKNRLLDWQRAAS
jgi:hypothetical protein